MRIIAHRGYSAKYTQNTLNAFQQALEAGADAIELDIHQVDDEFVVYHDFYLDKLTESDAKLSECRLADIKQLRLPFGETIPLLSDVATLISNQVLLNIEIKSLACVASFVEYLESKVLPYQSRIVLSSFDHPLLQECINRLIAHQYIQYAALIAHLPTDYTAYATRLNVDIAAISYEMVNRAFVEHAHAHQLEVWTYTVNKPEQIEEMLLMGVDGIFTDDCALAKRLLTTKS